MYGKDISSLLILKYTPTTYAINKYQITEVSESSDYFINQYLFEDSYMIDIGINAIIYFQELEKWQEDAILIKVRVKNTDAFYGNFEKYSEEKDNYYLLEQLSFFKDNIKYIITRSYYYYYGQEKNKLDFINYLDENLLPIN